MRVYAAGIYASNFDLDGTAFNSLTNAEKKARLSIEHVLESYWSLRSASAVAKIRRDRQKIFLDSGAFSAHSQGALIDLDDYCDFISEHQDIIETVDGVQMVAALDVIGDAAETWRNQQKMKRRGIRAIPTFHFGENVIDLDAYVARSEYVALGGLVKVPQRQQIRWLTEVFDKHLLNGAGQLRCRVHCFGVMSPRLMQDYPFTSVDSTTWVDWGGIRGMIFVPDYGQVVIGDEQRAQRRHFDQLSPAHRKMITATIEAAGFEVARLRARNYSRWAFNVAAFATLRM